MKVTDPDKHLWQGTSRSIGTNFERRPRQGSAPTNPKKDGKGKISLEKKKPQEKKKRVLGVHFIREAKKRAGKRHYPPKGKGPPGVLGGEGGDIGRERCGEVNWGDQQNSFKKGSNEGHHVRLRRGKRMRGCGSQTTRKR